MTSYLILPLFALANAGVVLTPASFNPASPVVAGIILGLVVGKPFGIALLAWAATWAGFAEKPNQVEWRQLFGAACLCGNGFTMSIFIATGGFHDQSLLTESKLSVMRSCLVSRHTATICSRPCPPQPGHTFASISDIATAADHLHFSPIAAD